MEALSSYIRPAIRDHKGVKVSKPLELQELSVHVSAYISAVNRTDGADSALCATVCDIAKRPRKVEAHKGLD